MYQDSNQIMYHVEGNKYCEHIGREHKSNHITFVVDLKNWVYYQKCFDPECSNFKSDPIDFSPSIFIAV